MYSQKIFLSYSSKDSSWATDFISILEDEGLDVFSAVRDIKHGDQWQQKIENALRESAVVIFILSENSIDSAWTYFEFGAAIAGDKKIVPIYIDDVEHPKLFDKYSSLKETSPVDAGKKVAEMLLQTEDV